MAFPVVQTSNETSVTAAGTSHAYNLPASIAAGDLLIIVAAKGGTAATTFNTLTGWTELVDENQTFGAAAWYRWADGTEGATVTFTSSGSNRSASIAYRISGAENPATQAPEMSAVGTGTSNAPDPNTVTPTGGSKDYLWITWFLQSGGEEADDDTWCNNAATNYGNLRQVTSGTGGVNVGAVLASCYRTNTAASEDASWPAGSTDQSLAWRAFTIAVHPVADFGGTATPAAIAVTVALDAVTATGGSGAQATVPVMAPRIPT